MPQVQPTEITSEESQKQLDNQEALQESAMSRIKGGNVFKSLEADLPQVSEENSDNDVSEGEQPQDELAQLDTNEEENIDEEVVPKSKIQPRIDQLTAQIKRLEQRLQEKQTEAPADSTQAKLDAMGEQELEDTLTQVRIAKEKSRDDEAKLVELIKLERQIEKTIVTAPQKFVSKQVSEANKTIDSLVESGQMTQANRSKILEIAQSIYNRYPKMQSAVDGQAMAIELAAEHYKTLGINTSTKTDNSNLKVQLNNLKKKTLLDTKSVKSGGEKVSLDRLRSNAMTGSMRDKEKFAHNDPRFKIDAMIPDFLKG